MQQSGSAFQESRQGVFQSKTEHKEETVVHRPRERGSTVRRGKGGLTMAKKRDQPEIPKVEK